MQAGVIDRVELVSDVSDSDSQAIHLKLADRSRRDLVFSRRTHKGHSPAPSQDSSNFQES
jgi:hypothetical protein